MTTTHSPSLINGINIDALRLAMDAIAERPVEGSTRWEVTSHWGGGTRSDTRITSSVIGGRRVAKDFMIAMDGPLELCSTHQHPNPQEYLLAALNACMIAGYTVGCALESIHLEELRIETEGEIDLRGFLGIAPDIKPGYDQLRYTVHIKGNGTPEQFERIHRTVMATSPNYFNLRNPTPLQSRLIVT
jgi:uncharacterized OsmC-like protein